MFKHITVEKLIESLKTDADRYLGPVDALVNLNPADQRGPPSPLYLRVGGGTITFLRFTIAIYMRQESSTFSLASLPGFWRWTAANKTPRAGPAFFGYTRC